MVVTFNNTSCYFLSDTNHIPFNVTININMKLDRQLLLPEHWDRQIHISLVNVYEPSSSLNIYRKYLSSLAFLTFELLTLIYQTSQKMKIFDFKTLIWFFKYFTDMIDSKSDEIIKRNRRRFFPITVWNCINYFQHQKKKT